MPRSFVKGGGSGSSGITVGTTTSDGTANVLLKTDGSAKVTSAAGLVAGTNNNTLAATSQAAGDTGLKVIGAASQSAILANIQGNASNLQLRVGRITDFVGSSTIYSNSVQFGVTATDGTTDLFTLTQAGLGYFPFGLHVRSEAAGAAGVPLKLDLVAAQSGDALQVVDSGSNVIGGFTGLGYVRSAGFSRVAADVTSTSATPAAITGLSATVAAGRTYKGIIELFYGQDVAADGFRFDLDGGSATATNIRINGTISDSTSTRYLGSSTALATDLTDTSTGTTALVSIHFTITVNAAGTIIPRFGLEAASTGTGTVFRGSTMQLVDIP